MRERFDDAIRTSRLRRRHADRVARNGRLLRSHGGEAAGGSEALRQLGHGRTLRATEPRPDRDRRRRPCRRRALAGLLARIADGTLSGKMAREVFDAMWAGEGAADAIIEARGLKQISDAGAHREDHRRRARREPQVRRGIPRRQGQGLQRAGGPGHEGDQGQGQSGAGQRDPEKETGRLLRSRPVPARSADRAAGDFVGLRAVTCSRRPRTTRGNASCRRRTSRGCGWLRSAWRAVRPRTARPASLPAGCLP